jgi:hypothetical protein
MQQPTLNGVQKPSDVIAKGPHRFNEGTRKYEEVPALFPEFPRAMWHATKGYCEASSKDHQAVLESEGWQSKPFPEKIVAKKEDVVPASGDVAAIVVQQMKEMQLMREQMQALQNQVSLAPQVQLSQSGEFLKAQVPVAETPRRKEKGE